MIDDIIEIWQQGPFGKVLVVVLCLSVLVGAVSFTMFMYYELSAVATKFKPPPS